MVIIRFHGGTEQRIIYRLPTLTDLRFPTRSLNKLLARLIKFFRAKPTANGPKTVSLRLNNRTLSRRGNSSLVNRMHVYRTPPLSSMLYLGWFCLISRASSNSASTSLSVTIKSISATSVTSCVVFESCSPLKYDRTRFRKFFALPIYKILPAEFLKR